MQAILVTDRNETDTPDCHGKEGVVGSSPTEGSRGTRCYSALFVAAPSSSPSSRRVAGYPVGTTPVRTASLASRITSTAGRRREGSNSSNRRPYMSRHVLGLCPSSGATSSTLRPSKISRLAKLPPEVARDRVGRQADGDRGGPEDPLAPVVPVAGRPLAEHELVVARSAAADAELGEVACERKEEASAARLDPAALR